MHDAVAIYDFSTHAQASQAIDALIRDGIDRKDLSLIGKASNNRQNPTGFYATDGQIRILGGLGTFWGEIWDRLLPPAVFALPGLGLMAIAGVMVHQFTGDSKAEESSLGASTVGAAMRRLGLTEAQVIDYEAALNADKFLLIAHGSADQLDKVRSIMADILLSAMS